ncbi:MAG TPA: recombination mediator RecR [Candidatus Methylacidiphilales bacterium]|nr:recombination mediator RecR [Candidatus Methylacidiphilales bacterium]
MLLAFVMAEYPPALQELIRAFRRLPSVGPRSAERLALHLLASDPSQSQRLAHAISHARQAIRPCRQCGFYSEADLCGICADSSRDTTMWCIVAQSSDVISMEKAGGFKGLYHVLGGRISPLEKIGPEQLSIAPLLQRIKDAPPAELILALSADVEGETTSLYLTPLIKKHRVKVSRLATGIPAGSGLEFADRVTLGYALSGRREV